MIDKHTNHFGEAQLELFLLAPGSIDPGLGKEIADHLAVCGACSALHADLEAMHRLIGEASSGDPSDEDRALVERLAGRGGGLLPSQGLRRIPDQALEGYAEVLEPTGRAIIRRIVRYVQVYPIRSAATFSFAAALAVLGVLTLRPTPDTNPVYAKFSGNILRVFNQRGDTLWTRLAPGMPEQGSERATSGSDKRVVMVEDIDGDGMSEVLVNGLNMETLFSAESLYCFTAGGGLKWTTGGGPVLRFGSLDHMTVATWNYRSFFTIRLPGEARPRLYAMAQAIPYMTSKLWEISPDDGHELQAYWHAGGLAFDVRCDLAGDTIPEIVLAAINNGFGCAALIVLDPKNISGYGTTTPEYVPSDIGKAEELYYVTIAPTDLARLESDHRYNTINGLVTIDRSTIQLTTTESSGDLDLGGIIYSFDRGMRLLSAVPNDPFIRNRDLAVKDGRLSGRIDSSYIERLKAGVQILGKQTATPRQ